MRKRTEAEIADPGIRQKVISSLKLANDSMMKVVNRGQLKKGKRVDKSNVNDANVVSEKRYRKESLISKGQSKKAKFDEDKGGTGSNKKMKRTSKVDKFKVGDTITASPKMFDGDVPGSYSSATLSFKLDLS
jgi:uncharacterized cupredoxin-like copper-binding protein